MKKLQIITLTALMASGVAYAALDWDGVDNLAKGASVTLSSNDSEGNRNSIVDDNNGSGWQANKDAANPDWALIDLGETKTFKDIEIKWEAARPNTYKVYVTAEAPTVTAGDTESTIAEVWLTANAEGSVEITAGEGDIAKTITVGSFDGSTQANIALVASATVDNGDNAAVVLNKSESTGLEDMYQPKNQNMAPYKLTIDLGKEYPADVIEVIWETAHASDFEILTGTDPNALTAAYTVAGRALRGYDNVIDRTMLEKNTPVRYIQIDVTGHAHEYPAAIRRVRLYNADSAEMLGITDITVEPAKARTIYNLQGIAVPADRMERGTIYIVDGVKMIIK